MRRRWSHSAQVGFLLLASSLVLQGQRGGMSGHFSGASHGGSSFSTPARSFAPPSRSFFSSPATRSPSFQGQLRHWPGGSSIYRNSIGVGYRRAYPFVYAGYPWLYPLNYGFLGGDGPGDMGAYQPPPQPVEPPADYEQTAEYAPSPYRPAYQEPALAPEPARDQPTTTLIFKDGRPPAQVHNYALTGTTLFALDGDSRRDIPLSLLDVPATVEANRAAGVDFSLPVSH